MANQFSRIRRIRITWWVALAIGFGLFALASLSLTQTKAKIEEKQVSSETQQPPDWAQVDRLVSEQKFEEAARAAEKLRLAAQKAGNRGEWTRALIKEVQLRTGLHGYETAVRFLKEQPWPDGLLNRATLNLFYARSLVNYYQSYSWEINQREKVESRGTVDLKAWTKDQIYAEAQKAYEEVWKQRVALGTEPVSRFGEFLDRNNYPEGIRSTLRDAISYLYVELLADTSLWTAQESNEIYRLDLKTLLASIQREVPLLDAAVHPLTKACFILGDLERWHAQNRRREAALEARLERLERLHAAFAGAGDRAAVAADLAKLLPEYRDVSWWAMGKAKQAEFVREGDQPSKLVRARAMAEEGWKAYPDSVGGKRCFSILKSIEAPDFMIASMAADGFQKRSIEINHKNLPSLYFRAYLVDLETRLQTARDYSLLLSSAEQEAILRTQAAAEWSVNLPATPDFEMHRTYVTPPMKNVGCYTVVASAKKDFSKSEGNRITAVMSIIGNLAVLSSRESTGTLEVRTLSGESGQALAGVTVSLYKYDWQNHHQKVDERVSDEDGIASFAYAAGRENAPHFLFARKGSDIAWVSNYLFFGRPEEPLETTASLVYTDRSVYRPLQKIFWKVLAYKGRSDKARFDTLPAAPVSVSLIDPNGQKVDERIATTSGFGSAAGEFTIPTGRLLGNWRIQSSLNGNAFVKVEEYKRPTFEVTIKDSESPLRLNRPATLSGEVKYYFGLPVTNGSVKWRATREPVYPRWWGWYGRHNAGSPGTQTVAVGTAALKEDGTFKITFTPEADERNAAESKDITYRYRVTADVTDEGGETRSASKTFRLGFVSVEAGINTDAGFFREGVPSAFEIVRTDLNGAARVGKGSWRLVSLQQPETTPLPADLPLTGPRQDKTAGDEYRTPGDSLRPRWNPQYNYESVLRSWPEGVERGRGNLVHGENGEAKLALPALPPGAYRVYYNTVDDFGSPYETSKEFIVAGQKTPLALPALLIGEKRSESVGGKARFLALSGLSDQPLFFEVWRDGRLSERRKLLSGRDATLIEIPIRDEDRGGFGARLLVLRDYQLMDFNSSISVPWDNKQLKVEFATFRDKLRPGAKETWRVTVKGPSGANVEAGAAELLAYMYDRSLDIFAPHQPPDPLRVYSRQSYPSSFQSNLGQAPSQFIIDKLFSPPAYPTLSGDHLKFYDNYGVGGPGMRRYGYGRGGGIGRVAQAVMVQAERAPAAPMAMDRLGKEETKATKEAATQEAPAPLRTDFAETAFWRPQLLTGSDGSAAIEFTVPDSVTAWNVWVHAVTRDLKGGSLHKEARSVKDLMVRPYLPRFLREGDKAELKVVVNNASEREFTGKVTLDILDPESNESLLKSFGLQDAAALQPFSVAAGKGTNLTFPISAPAKVGLAAFKVTAAAGDISDGELRPLPVLPGRMHLAQSRFVTLKNKDRREMTFEDLKKLDDPTRVSEQMVVTLDAQLFYSVLSALPYLVNYPYECTEQTLNRFVSTGILSSLYKNYPAVAKMAEEFAKRDTRLETWDSADPNRKMALEETPWLTEAKGGKDAGFGMANVLDPRIANAERETALAKLRKAQTAIGAFPWWPGGPPSPYMTLYIMYGFAKASEFGVDVPKDMIQRGWAYLAQHFREEYAKKMLKEDCCWEFLTFLNYTASCYPDPSWMGNALTAQERRDILDHGFKHWKQHSPYLKGQLALTLKRMGRPRDAALVFASVMDSAKSTQDEGTFWAPEDRSWLWYNDTIETHAFALRTLMELEPGDARKDGLVQWLFLNKKLNHWKSTRATAEVIYSLVHYLKTEGALATREDATVRAGGQTVQYVFEPDKYTGKKNQTIIPGDKVDASYATVVVEKESPGFVFASATWQFSTEKLPEEGRGDFLAVSRTYFKRENAGREFVLKPLAEGAALQPGDEVEIHLSIRAKHPCEYVHLRDPRAAGLEAENAASRFKWDMGIGWYEEVRDSGTNFFFEWLPQGEYTFKYRLRANMAGTFKVAPATLQSMYAPEFSAYSAGAVLTVK
jgi:uncharacterized protein YfaS (alpha-2-macroglobulin family)